MPDPSPFSVEELIQPLSEPGPIGARLRTADSVHDELRELVSQTKKAMENEKKASDAGNDPSLAGLKEWSRVKELGEKLLRETSKDLEVAGLMVTAAVRTDGLAGLVSGLELTAELVERYWSEILDAAKAAAQAAAEEEARQRGTEVEPIDEEAIVSELIRVVERWRDVLPAPIGWIPFTAGNNSDSFAMWQYEQAVQAERLSPEEREKRKAVTIDRIIQSADQKARQDPDYFPRLVALLEEAGAKATRVEAAFQNQLSGGLAGLAPSLERIKERLDDIKRCLAHVAKDYLILPTQGAGDAAGGAGTAGAGSPGAGILGQPQNRDEAFRQLLAIADFFARTEPLSLLAEQIRLVVQRARSSPEKYFADLIDNEETRRQLFRLVGIRPSQEESHES